ncbi:MAG: DUF4122 domain-containing protein [Prevotellaceae bacterium]|jgi:hypothetical protein|nr:DUF4122 domain-containing protein [Prevotellaceae bacterium]
MNMLVLLVALIWLMFSLLYFNREVSDFLNGRRNRLPPPGKAEEKKEGKKEESEKEEDSGVFGKSRTDSATFFACSDENNILLGEKSNEHSNKNVTFVEGDGAEEGLSEEESGKEMVDISSLFDVELKDYEEEEQDSDDAVSEEEGIAPVVKTFDELSEDVSDMMKVMAAAGADGCSTAENVRACRALNELRGTDLFSQVENAAGGAEKVELLRRELDALWQQEYEQGNSQQPAEIDF